MDQTVFDKLPDFFQPPHLRSTGKENADLPVREMVKFAGAYLMDHHRKGLAIDIFTHLYPTVYEALERSGLADPYKAVVVGLDAAGYKWQVLYRWDILRGGWKRVYHKSFVQEAQHSPMEV